MVFAVVAHCPSFGGTLSAAPSAPSGRSRSCRSTSIAGTGRGTELVGNVNAVAVVAPHHLGRHGLARELSPKWTLPANAARAEQRAVPGRRAGPADRRHALRRRRRQPARHGVHGGRQRRRCRGRDGPRRHGEASNASYTLPYLSHACMEVLNCTVDYVPGVNCEVWAPTQGGASALAAGPDHDRPQRRPGQARHDVSRRRAWAQGRARLHQPGCAGGHGWNGRSS